MRCLQELRTSREHGTDDGDGARPSFVGQQEWERLEQEEWERRNAASPRPRSPSVLSYSGQDMKKAYYQAFWRARCVALRCVCWRAVPLHGLPCDDDMLYVYLLCNQNRAGEKSAGNMYDVDDAAYCAKHLDIAIMKQNSIDA